MRATITPLSRINHEVIQVLTEDLGVADALRFLNQISTGFGDYTEDRRKTFDHMTL